MARASLVTEPPPLPLLLPAPAAPRVPRRRQRLIHSPTGPRAFSYLMWLVV